MAAGTAGHNAAVDDNLGQGAPADHRPSENTAANRSGKTVTHRSASQSTAADHAPSQHAAVDRSLSETAAADRSPSQSTVTEVRAATAGGPSISVQPRRTRATGYLAVAGDLAPRDRRASDVEAILCDLDDTLYPQAAWLDGAWSAVAAAGARWGVEERAFLAALRADAAVGSARGGIIDRALVDVGVGGGAELVAELLAAFRAYRPVRLEPYPGVREALVRLRVAGVRLAVVTDGDVEVQAWKVRALGLSAFFECVVVSDALGGRGVRKPSAVPFLAAVEGLGVRPERCVVVGDRPEKDVMGALGADIRAVRVKTGEYRQVADVAGTWHTAADFPAAVDWLLRE
ncbi:HAD family hydrolase [Catenulispora acidiphila]|nr:HAD family hydrolase [Catenulispora acidiphila]